MKRKDTFVFNPEEWLTPNTYDKNFSLPVKYSGVYLLVNTEINYLNGLISRAILYIGSSSNIYVRYNKHEVMRLLKKSYDYIQFFFLQTENYIELEKKLIKQVQPKFNTQWL